MLLHEKMVVAIFLNGVENKIWHHDCLLVVSISFRVNFCTSTFINGRVIECKKFF